MLSVDLDSKLYLDYTLNGSKLKVFCNFFFRKKKTKIKKIKFEIF